MRQAVRHALVVVMLIVVFTESKYRMVSVYAYQVPAPVYVDGKTNVGPDGELLDRVLEEDEK